MLLYLASRAQPVLASAIAEDCDIPKQTLYPMLDDMLDLGFVSYSPDERRWGLGVAAFEIGSAYLRSEPLQRLGRPVLARLADRVGETSHLAVLHGNEALYLVKHVPSASSSALITDVGVRLPAHLTAVGRAMLTGLSSSQLRALYPSRRSFVQRTGEGVGSLTELHRVLREDRARGFSVESDQTTAGVSCIAAAVYDHQRRPAAAVGISFVTGNRDRGQWPQMARAVQQAADSLTARIHGQRAASGS